MARQSNSASSPPSSSLLLSFSPALSTSTDTLRFRFLLAGTTLLTLPMLMAPAPGGSPSGAFVCEAAVAGPVDIARSASMRLSLNLHHILFSSQARHQQFGHNMLLTCFQTHRNPASSRHPCKEDCVCLCEPISRMLVRQCRPAVDMGNKVRHARLDTCHTASICDCKATSPYGSAGTGDVCSDV